MSTPATEPGPARAITSNLHARSPPSVPKAEVAYEPHVRAVLRQRQLREIFPLSLLFVWLCESVWIYVNISRAGNATLGFLGKLAVPFKPGTVLASVLTWTFVVLPVLIARRDNLSPTATSAASPSALLKAALAKRTTRSLVILYTVSALDFFILQNSISRLFGTIGPLNFDIFVKSKKHPYYLNGRLVYAVLAHIFVGFAYSVRNIMLDRWAVRWKESFSQRNAAKFAQRLLVVSISSLVFTSASLALYTFLFGVARAFVLPVLLNLPVISLAFRPFCAHFVRGRWTVFLPFTSRNLGHIWVTFVLNFSFVAALEWAETLFDENVRKPLAIAPHTADQGVTLVSGVTSTSIYYKQFAFHELRDFASDETSEASAARTALFADQKHNPTLWATLVREALLVLGNDYQLLLRRGKPAPPPTPAPAPEKPQLPAFPTTPLRHDKIFKSSTTSPINAALNALAADGALTQAVENSASNLPSVFQPSPATGKIATQSIFPARAPAELIPVPAAKAVVAPAKGNGFLGAWVAKVVPASVKSRVDRVGEWWTSERPSKVAESALPNRELDALVIETLCYLVGFSLTEDSYGVVQRDIPRILEALTSFLTAVEEYQKELGASLPAGPADAPELSARERRLRARKEEEIRKARDVLAVADDALKNGLTRVVQTFGSKMSAFKFPPRTGDKLQEFVNYSQSAVGTRDLDQY